MLLFLTARKYQVEVDSLYTRAWNDIYFGPLSQSFLGQAPINDRQSARDYALAMQLLFQQDVDALGGITFRSEETYRL